jgi:hypothetical protein
VADALDAQACAADAVTRAALVLRTRSALDGWLDGTMTTAQVVRALLVDASSGAGPAENKG